MSTTTASPELATLTGTWTIDPSHSTLGFAVKHAMVTTVRGRFADFDGTLHIDGEDPTRSSAVVAARVASIDTRSEQRDEHLRSADFFEVDKHPVLTFRSTEARRGRREGEYVLRGDLTIKGITKPVQLELEHTGAVVDPWGNDRIGFEGSATINRKDWDLTWNMFLEAGGVAVGEKVKITVDVSATRAN